MGIAPPSVSRFAGSAVIVGREAELAALRAALDRLVAGQGATLLISGEPGIGKSTLCEILAGLAESRNVVVRRGRCDALTHPPPFGVWREALGGLETTGPPFGSPSSSPPSLEAVRSGVRNVIAHDALQSPLVIALEDIHWADVDSLDLLRAMVRPLGQLPVLLVTTFRDDELSDDHVLAQMLPMVRREPSVQQLELRRLGRAAVGELLGARYGDLGVDTRRLLDFVYARADGNPFVITELLRTLEHERLLVRGTQGWSIGVIEEAALPSLLRQIVADRLSVLDAREQWLLAVAAVVGHEIDLELWATVVEAAEAELLALVDRAVTAHLLVVAPDGERVRFSHALVRQALYEGILPSLLPTRRRGWHARVAESLERLRPTDFDTIAYHFEQAHDSRATEWLIRAGERAQRSQAWGTAVERYAKALERIGRDGPPSARRGWILARLAWGQEIWAGRSVDLLQERADAEAGGVRDPLLSVAVDFVRGYSRCLSGDLGRGLGDIETALGVLDAQPDPRKAWSDVLGGLGLTPDQFFPPNALFANWLAYSGRFSDATHVLARQAEAGPAADGYSAWASGYIQAVAGNLSEARSQFARGRAAYRSAQLRMLESSCALEELWRVHVPYRVDVRAVVSELILDVEQLFDGASEAPSAVTARLLGMWLAGEWDRAVECSAEYGLAEPALVHAFWAREVIARIGLARGDTAMAWLTVKAALPDGPATRPGDSFFPFALAAQLLAVQASLAIGDAAQAGRWLESNDAWLAWSGAQLGRAENALFWASYHRSAGDWDAAKAGAARACALAESPLQPLTLIAGRRMAGQLFMERGDLNRARAELERSLRLADACDVPYERALSLLAFGELAIRLDKASAAQDALSRSRAVLARLRADPALGRLDGAGLALDELRLRENRNTRPARGARHPRLARPAGLSARELQVLKHMAAGGTDASIAQALCISVRTVNGHVSSILAKTSNENRAAAAAWAARQGLV
ncbi:MAG: BREX system ATP-binding domain-containing protein [Chloroflexota bacterium]